MGQIAWVQVLANPVSGPGNSNACDGTNEGWYCFVEYGGFAYPWRWSQPFPNKCSRNLAAPLKSQIGDL
jgi:hypothetical protein